MSVVNGPTPKSLLKQLANDAGVRLQDLLVLASANDPFNCGGPEQVKQAEWFAAIWSRFMGEKSGHLRKLHYKLVSQVTPILKPDGTVYQNTEADWQRLQTWSKFARYLGLVDPRQIVDQRNPDPHLFAPHPVDPEEPSWSIESWHGFDLPSIPTQLWTDFSLPVAIVEGYQYHAGEQPYLLELWEEKSTMDDDLTEAACKTVFTQRLKLSGMRWSHEGAARILTLRTILLSGTWESTYGASLKANAVSIRCYTPNAATRQQLAA
jgi:hypothetical protein